MLSSHPRMPLFFEMEMVAAFVAQARFYYIEICWCSAELRGLEIFQPEVYCTTLIMKTKTTALLITDLFVWKG